MIIWQNQLFHIKQICIYIYHKYKNIRQKKNNLWDYYDHQWGDCQENCKRLWNGQKLLVSFQRNVGYCLAFLSWIIRYYRGLHQSQAWLFITLEREKLPSGGLTGMLLVLRDASEFCPVEMQLSWSGHWWSRCLSAQTLSAPYWLGVCSLDYPLYQFFTSYWLPHWLISQIKQENYSFTL